MVEFSPQKQLEQELLFHAHNSANRALNFWGNATRNRLEENDLAADGCQILGNLNARDALFEAYEAGEVVSTNQLRKESDDPEFIRLSQLASDYMNMAITNISRFELLSMIDDVPEDLWVSAWDYKSKAIDQAYAAGKYSGDGKRSGIRPTATILPEEWASK